MLYSTEDALAAGLTATATQKAWWGKLRLEFSRQFYAAIARGQLDLAGMFATQAQLCREAIEAETITRTLKNVQ